MHRLVLPIQGWHHIDLPLCSQQPCHTGSHINLPVFSGWSEEVMKWRLQDLHLWNFWWLLLLFFDTSLANSYFRKHKFCFQSRTDIRHLQPPVFDVTCVTSGVSSPPLGSKMFLPIHEALGVYVWEASEESASAAWKTLIFSTSLWKARHLR